jgi:hypothetical protein
MKTYLKRAMIGISALVCLGLISASPLADDSVPKEVRLIINGSQLVASNIRFSRFDTLRLKAQEKIREHTEAKGVILVVTNQRIIGYGVSSGWKDIKRQAGEQIKSFYVEDFAAFVTTDNRYLNFNGETGLWARQDRRTVR